MSSAAQPPILNRIIHERTGKMSRSLAISGCRSRTSSFQSQISGSERKRSRCCHLSLNNFFLFLVTDTRKGRERRAIFASLSPEHFVSKYICLFRGEVERLVAKRAKKSRFERRRKRKRVRESSARRKNYSVSFKVAHSSRTS